MEILRKQALDSPVWHDNVIRKAENLPAIAVMVSEYEVNGRVVGVEIKGCRGDTLVVPFHKLCKYDNYYLAFPVGYYSGNYLASKKWFFINKYVTRNNVIKERPDSETKKILTDKFNKLLKVNAKAKMINAGLMDLVNEQITYIPDKNSVHAKIPAICESIGIYKSHIGMSYCDKLETITDASKIKEYHNQEYAFTRVDKISFLNDSVVSFGNNLFDNSGIKEIEIPKSVRRIAPCCFNDCYFLEKVTFNGTLKYLGEGAFYNCSALTEIRLPNGLGTIKRNTFALCGSLRKVVIPKSVTKLEKDWLRPFDLKSKSCVIVAPRHLKKNLLESLSNTSNIKFEFYN